MFSLFFYRDLIPARGLSAAQGARLWILRRITLKAPDSYHHGHLRTELLRLGLEALEAEGAELISLRSLAERAGVSKTAPYRHFKDKEDFLGAVADEGFRLLCGELERAEAEAAGGTVASGQGSGGTVAVMGKAYMDFAVGHPALYRLMNSPLICGLPEGSLLWARRSLLLLGKALASDSAKPGTQAGTLAGTQASTQAGTQAGAQPSAEPPDSRRAEDDPRARADQAQAGLRSGAQSGAQSGGQNPALDIDAIASSWGYIHGIVLLRIDGLFPRDLPQPDWNRLAATVPKLP